MADNKQQAISEAKDAALGSVSFAIYGTKNEADALKKSSLLAARNAVAVRKNMLLVVAKFQAFHAILANIKSALGKKGDATSKLNAVNAALSAGGNAYAQAEADQESKPSALSLISGAANDIASATPAIAGLALAIPFLLSPEVRDIISGFFDGFLKGLGLSTEAIDKAKNVLLIAAGVVGAIFSFKALAPVFQAFMALKRLAEVMGLMGQATAMEKAKIDKEKDDVAEGSKKAKDEVKGNKDEIRKAKKAGKGSKTKIGKLWDKGKYLFERVSPKLKKMIPNILKAIPIVGSIIGIGFILYDLFSIGRDIYDVFFGDDDKDPEEDQQTEQEQAPAAAATAPASGALPSPSATPESKPAAAATPSPQPSAPASSAPAEPGGMGGAAPAGGGSTSAPATPAPSTGTAVAAASVTVQQAETDAVQNPIVSIAVVDNTSTVIHAGDKKSQQNMQPATFSVTVGT